MFVQTDFPHRRAGVASRHQQGPGLSRQMKKGISMKKFTVLLSACCLALALVVVPAEAGPGCGSKKADKASSCSAPTATSAKASACDAPAAVTANAKMGECGTPAAITASAKSGECGAPSAVSAAVTGTKTCVVDGREILCTTYADGSCKPADASAAKADCATSCSGTAKAAVKAAGACDAPCESGVKAKDAAPKKAKDASKIQASL
jgi:hypothetical protein